MSISSRIARPLLASIFISGGVDAIQSPEGKVKSAAAVTEPLKARFAFLPEDRPPWSDSTEWSRWEREDCSLSASSPPGLVGPRGVGDPTTYAGHRFWDEVDDEARTGSACTS